MPRVDYFKATSAYAVKKHLESSRLADTAYVQLAVPLAPEAAPYVLFYVDIIHLLNKIRNKLLNSKELKFGILTIHLLNKIRNKLLNSKELKFGILTINKDHLLLINTMSKDKHGLNDTDASTKDRMKFDPTWRIMQKDVRDCFEEFVPGSEGTVMLLQLMSQIYEAYCEINLVPLERIFKIWHALFLIRCWRHKCIELKSVGKECITSNAYQYLELDAHGLVLLAEMCRDCPEQFLVLCFSSQPAEEVFRELRSMTANQ
ncbi:hypothetical protein quinque_013964 [Culex quinquefasciatus]